MAQPPNYTRQYNFTDFATTNPSDPLPGVQVDGELNKAKLTLDALVANIGLVQRDDGLLANASVHKDAFDTNALALIGLSGYTNRGNWSAGVSYAVGDLVNFNSATYLATIAHTSSAAFATDTASKWILLANGAINTTSYAVDKFEGTGSQTAFTLSFSYSSTTDVLVFVNGALKNPTDDYTISGTTLTFGAAPSTPSQAGNENVIIWGGAVVAEAAKAAATASASNASGFADEADNWARKTTGLVESTDYSSKAWAIGGTGVTDTASKGAAKEWAIKTSGTVDGTNYSSKYWATSTPVTNVSTHIADVTTVAGQISPTNNIATVAGKATQITTLAGLNTEIGNLSPISAAISGVNTISTAVSAVHTNATNINAVAAVDTDVTTVAGQISPTNNISTVAGKATQIATLAGLNTEIGNLSPISAAITGVNTISTAVSAVHTNATNINNVAAQISPTNNISTLAGLNTEIAALYGIRVAISEVAAIDDKIVDIHTDLAKVTTVANDLLESTSEIEVVAGSIANVDSLAAVLTGNTTYTVTVVNVGGTNVFAIDGVATATLSLVRGNTYIFNQEDNTNSNHPLAFKDSSGNSYTTGVTVSGTAGSSGATVTFVVASNAPNSLRYYCTVHGNAMGNTISTSTSNLNIVAGSIANINLTGGSIANVNAVGGAIENVNTVASNLTGVNAFGNQYSVGSSDPTSNLDEGDLFFNTTSDTMKVYNGSSWQNAGSSVNGTSERGSYTATANQTTFAATYDVGFIDIYANGAKQLVGTDVTATSGSNFVFASGLAAGDIVEFVAYGTFNVSTSLAKSGGTMTGAITFASGQTFPGVDLSGKASLDGATFTGAIQANGGVVFNEGSADVDFRVESNGNANMLFVDGGNNAVGIGTSSPSNDLEIITSADAKGLTLKNAGNNRPYLNFDSNRSSAGNNLAHINFAWNGTDAARIIAVAGADTTNKDDGHLVFQTASAGSPAERLRITSAGLVGIGTTSPSMTLDVDGTGGPNDVARFSGPNSGGLTFRNATSNEFIMHTATSDALIFGTAGNNERMRITNAGKVGIGTNAPNGLFEVHTAQNTTNQFTTPHLTLDTSSTTNLTGFTGIAYSTSTGPNFGITAGALRSQANGKPSFVVNTHEGSASGTERFRISDTGQLGIGGANYGTSGQVLTSGGSGAAPSWADAGGASYETGSWTPSLGGNTTYSSQNGEYTKVGNMVTVWCNIYVTVLGTGSQTTISGLPYAISNITEFNVNGSHVSYYVTAANNASGYTATTSKNTSNIIMRRIPNGGSASMNSYYFFRNSTDVYFTLTYHTGS